MINAVLIDGVILLSLTVFLIVRTYNGNFREEKTNLIAFSFATIIALASYREIASLFSHIIPFARPILITLAFWLTLVLFDFLTRTLLTHTFTRGILFKDIPPKWEKYALPLVVFIEGMIFIAFVTAITFALPLDKHFKKALRQSSIVSFISPQMTRLELAFHEGIGETTDQAFDFLTTHPLKARAKTAETVKLQPMKHSVAIIDKLTPNPQDENEMFSLVNKIRKKYDYAPLTLRAELVPIARVYATKMWQEKFFGHVDLSGQDAGDRLNDAKIAYQIVGENVAISSDITSAHIGLINSQEHLDNILDPQFRQLGIGVIENGSLGKIFVQIFTD